MKVFLTGATGYIGRRTLALLVEEDHQVTAVVRSEDRIPDLHPKAQPWLGDFSDVDRFKAVLSGYDAVIHLGFPSHGRGWLDAVKLEAEWIQDIAEHLSGGTTRLIVANGTAFLGDGDGRVLDENAPVDPEHPAAPRAKATAPATQTPGLSGIELRFASFVYGDAGSVFLPVLSRTARSSGKVPLVEGGTKRLSAVHVQDAARAVLSALRVKSARGVFHVASDESPTLRQLAEALAKGTGAVVTPMDLAQAAQLTDPFTAMFLNLDNRLSSLRARTELGWAPEASTGLLWDVAFGSYRL